jgi:hypothetical protein
LLITSGGAEGLCRTEYLMGDVVMDILKFANECAEEKRISNEVASASRAAYEKESKEILEAFKIAAVPLVMNLKKFEAESGAEFIVSKGMEPYTDGDGECFVIEAADRDKKKGIIVGFRHDGSWDIYLYGANCKSDDGMDLIYGEYPKIFSQRKYMPKLTNMSKISRLAIKGLTDLGLYKPAP